jgi:V8-like Glu-specific endopeptidase
MNPDILLAQDDEHGLAARGAVGRIESPQGTARGTGVLVDRQLLLTCKHVVERILGCGLERAWVRFGYKTGTSGIEPGEVFELGLKSIVTNNRRPDHGLDYALVRIISEPGYPTALLSTGWLNGTQSVRIVHHPRGKPAQISDVGQIVVIGKEYIQHNIKTDYGSSGAPLFDLSWRVVAIHRGTLSLSRSYAPGITEGIPIYSIWNDIRPHLSM